MRQRRRHWQLQLKENPNSGAMRRHCIPLSELELSDELLARSNATGQPLLVHCKCKHCCGLRHNNGSIPPVSIQVHRDHTQQYGTSFNGRAAFEQVEPHQPCSDEHDGSPLEDHFPFEESSPSADNSPPEQRKYTKEELERRLPGNDGSRRVNLCKAAVPKDLDKCPEEHVPHLKLLLSGMRYAKVEWAMPEKCAKYLLTLFRCLSFVNPEVAECIPADFQKLIAAQVAMGAEPPVVYVYDKCPNCSHIYR